MKKSDAIAHFGTQTALAIALRISQAAVSKWPELVPEKQAMKLAYLTDDRLAYDPSFYTRQSNDVSQVSQVAIG